MHAIKDRQGKGFMIPWLALLRLDAPCGWCGGSNPFLNPTPVRKKRPTAPSTLAGSPQMALIPRITNRAMTCQQHLALRDDSRADKVFRLAYISEDLY
jgi:hypothetical protein